MLSRVTAKNVGDVFFETHCRSSHFYSASVRPCIHFHSEAAAVWNRLAVELATSAGVLCELVEYIHAALCPVTKSVVLGAFCTDCSRRKCNRNWHCISRNTDTPSLVVRRTRPAVDVRRPSFPGYRLSSLEQSATPRYVCTVTACFPQSSEDPSLQTQFSLTTLLCLRSDTRHYGHVNCCFYLLTYLPNRLPSTIRHFVQAWEFFFLWQRSRGEGRQGAKVHGNIYCSYGSRDAYIICILRHRVHGFTEISQ